MTTDTYHHGDLRNALLKAVGAIIAERGVGAVSLREAARRAGVSHSAPAHHFGDKLGMLTAFACRGFEEFGQRMQAAADAVAAEGVQAQIRAIGIEYVRFALEERPAFEVMFRSELHDPTDEAFREASHAAFGVLMSTVESMSPVELNGGDPVYVAMGSWATVHGLATLWLDGALAQFSDEHLIDLTLGVFDAGAHS